MLIGESINQAFSAIRENKLRSGLTLLSIVIGIFAIMFSGILVKTIDDLVTDELASLGENNFNITRMPSVQLGNSSWRKYRDRPVISYRLFKELKKESNGLFGLAATSSTGSQKAEAGNVETNSNVEIVGVSGDYFDVMSKNVVLGRPINASDVFERRDYAVIGQDLAFSLYGRVRVVGESFKIGNTRYEIVGLLEYEGPLLGNSRDNKALIPLTTYLASYDNSWESVEIIAKAESQELLDATIDFTVGAMRGLRELMPWDDNDFEVATNESISNQFKSLTSYIEYFGIIVGFFSMLVAGIGIMNIMLITVKERTREIGIRKALGAKPATITLQFLVETIVLCLIGGLLGIMVSFGVSFLLGMLTGIKVSVPLNITLLSVAVCSVIGLIFGFFPAKKASSLDPIEALRYE
ncbi:MAG: ABC transporter permease [Candidatus Kapaibacteriales bacterium]